MTTQANRGAARRQRTVRLAPHPAPPVLQRFQKQQGPELQGLAACRT